MKLLDLIRKKFLPPYGDHVYRSSNLRGYVIHYSNGKFVPALERKGYFKYSKSNNPYFVYDEYEAGGLITSFEDSSSGFESASEMCWDNFDLCYKGSTPHKEPV